MEFMKLNGSLENLGVTILGLAVLTLLFVPTVSAAGKYKMLYRFKDGRDGGFPYAGLIFDPAGNLYGTTFEGGPNNRGTVFKLTPSGDGGWTETVLYSFTGGADGGGPSASLILDATGNLYSTTAFGGVADAGTVFVLTPSSDGTWTESVLYSFCSLTNCLDGSSPTASVIFDTSGNLYGTTGTGGSGSGAGCDQGCGTVFKLTPNPDGTWIESVLYSFCSLTACSDGAVPSIALLFDMAGNLYGTAGEGGLNQCGFSFGCGVVFKLSEKPNGSWKEEVLHHFTGGKDGANPLAGLIFDHAENLYGTTSGDGAYGFGIVFQLTLNPHGHWKERVLHAFTGGKDGSLPRANLIFDAAGNLFGTAEEGGNLSYCNGNGCGVAFKLTSKPNGEWHQTVLHRFGDSPGVRPFAGLTLDTSGDLYGTTYGDGSRTHGSVFEIAP
jgi:uncharacterized repeat protein (TIGR03803 family)